MGEKIKVLIVDDSAIVRDVLASRLGSFPDIEVVGVAPDPYVARDKIVFLNPDVVTLDIEMPRMDGLTFLERLMLYRPLPVIIVSSVTSSDKSAALKALAIGAFDVVNKPGGAISVGDIVEEVAYKIRQAYEVRESYCVRRAEFGKKYIEGRQRAAISVGTKEKLGDVKTSDKLLCIGASTGGTVALEYILQRLPQNLPPLLVVQHMPANFTRQFAERLNQLSRLRVKEAEAGELVQHGVAYIAPGGYHLKITRKGVSVYVDLGSEERIHYQRPAADALFASVAEVAGRNAVAALLTGMGKDGAAGLLALRQRGSRTIAQDEESSVVWGMPKAAIDLGAAEEVLSLEDIPERLVALARLE